MPLQAEDIQQCAEGTIQATYSLAGQGLYEREAPQLDCLPNSIYNNCKDLKNNNLSRWIKLL